MLTAAFFVAAFFVLWFAASRALRARSSLSPIAAVVLGALAAALATLPPLLLLTSDAPMHPPGARGEGETLETEFAAGWQPAVSDVAGRRVRWMGGEAQLVVGQLVAVRPPTTLSFRAEGVGRERGLTIGLAGTELASVTLPPSGRTVRVDVPPGEGPAVLVFKVSPAAPTSVAVPVDSVRVRPTSMR